ncbi:hypothetical protein K1719_001874 [Acacia pycnantha]|nr:hypothetical protein K1719_001874 [Acacia pycnantha]
MKKIDINGAAPYLHDEIIICILSRLPAKSLMRFQCVCKHWKNLFKNSSFIADHLHHSHQNASLIISQGFVRNIRQLLLIDCEMQFRYIQKAPPPFDSSPRNWFFHIIGSSNGLLFLEILKSYRFPTSLLVWNPVTRDLREVPESRINGYGCKLGFGFSPVVNDYKIVAINSGNDGRVCGVRVYSLSRNSWKEIEFGDLKDVTCHGLKISTNGAIFNRLTWENEKVIVSFDIAMEVFTLIPWPPLSGTNPSSSLTVYEDKLALLIVSEIGRRSSNVNLWVMEEDISSTVKRWNWIKKFTSGIYPWKFVLGTIWRNEIVVSRKRKYADSLYLFNVSTNEFKTFAFHHRTPLNLLNYVESLVPIVNVHNIEES